MPTVVYLRVHHDAGDAPEARVGRLLSHRRCGREEEQVGDRRAGAAGGTRVDLAGACIPATQWPSAHEALLTIAWSRY